MFLSLLHINIGDNPDRPIPGRLWLRNMYHVHQRLAMAFPSDPRKANDPHFLKPYDPGDFPEHRHLADRNARQIARNELRHVHAKRNLNSGFLFRIDSNPGHNVVILVLSAIRPDWDYAFHNASYLLADPSPKIRPLHLNLEMGSTFRFRLLANPTKKVATIPKKKRDCSDQQGRHGRRVPVPSTEEALSAWLAERAKPAGFSLKSQPLIQTGFVYFNKTRERNKGQRLFSVRYDGILEVADPTALQKAICSGIGPAKAFGFGLLSLAPV